MAQYLRPWDRSDVFMPILTIPRLLGCPRLKVPGRIAGERYAFRLRDVQAGGRY
jgi:hypothetical protein